MGYANLPGWKASFALWGSSHVFLVGTGKAWNWMNEVERSSLKKCSQSLVNFLLANFPLGWRTGNYWVTTSKPALQNQRCGGMCVCGCVQILALILWPLYLLQNHAILFRVSCCCCCCCWRHTIHSMSANDPMPLILALPRSFAMHTYTTQFRTGQLSAIGREREQTRIHSQNMTECGQNAFPPILQAVPACTNVRFKAWSIDLWSMLEDFCNSCWRNQVFYDMLWHFLPF